MKRSLTLAAALLVLGALCSNAALVGSTAEYKLYDGGGYSGSIPTLGTYNSSGVATWAASTLYPGLAALTPGGNEAGPGYDNWFPLGYGNFSASILTSIVAPSAGTYTFGTFSDDGSALYIDGTLVVNNGGEHSPLAAFNTVTLTAGVHQMYVVYYEGAPLFQANLTVYADNALAPVPEPTTLIAGALLLVPLGLLTLRRSRQD